MTRRSPVPDSYRETELKFSVPAAWRLPDLRTAELPEADPPKRAVLTATYYDTDDLRLARSGVTLRRRTGGSDAGWHVKLPVGGEGRETRDEIRLPLRAGAAGQVPAELADVVRALTRGAELLPRATVRTRRTTVVLRDTHERPSVEVADDRVAISEGPLDGTSYREIETEALAPSAPLARIADHLVLSGAERSAVSKGIRAIAGDVALVPVVPAPQPCSPDADAATAVANLLRTQVAALIGQDLRMRRDLPDSVHQFRVAARRLRSGLQSFGPLVDQRWAKRTRAELGWAAGTMGASRDREVLEERLMAGLRALPQDIDRAAGLVVVRDTLDADRLAAAGVGRAALASPRYLALLDALVAAANDPPTTARAAGRAGDVLPPLVVARWDTLERAARGLADEIDGHDDLWHRTRIDSKKARYTAEAVVPVFGAPAKAFAQQLARVTDLLGRHQDCAIAAATVAAMVDRDTGPRAAFALGALYEQQREELREVRRAFLLMWPEVERGRWRRWLKDSR